MNAMDFFPWSARKVLGGETVTISKVSQLPPEASRDQESYRAYATKSTVQVPLSVGGGPVFGLLTFAVLRNERCWTETEVSGFKLIAQVIACTLARTEAEKALREREAGLRLAINVAGAGLWSMNLDTQEVWVAAKTRELWAFPPDEKLTYQSFSKVIHPEDRERCHGRTAVYK